VEYERMKGRCRYSSGKPGTVAATAKSAIGCRECGGNLGGCTTFTRRNVNSGQSQSRGHTPRTGSKTDGVWGECGLENFKERALKEPGLNNL
jgi:hypothetical protein